MQNFKDRSEKTGEGRSENVSTQCHLLHIAMSGMKTSERCCFNGATVPPA